MVYAKNERSDLTKEQLALLKKVVEREAKMTAEEELITMAKPPSPNQPYKDKKCWKRSFVLEGEVTSAGRMLTTYVCEDVQSWFAGFRILQ